MIKLSLELLQSCKVEWLFDAPYNISLWPFNTYWVLHSFLSRSPPFFLNFSENKFTDISSYIYGGLDEQPFRLIAPRFLKLEGNLISSRQVTLSDKWQYPSSSHTDLNRARLTMCEEIWGPKKIYYANIAHKALCHCGTVLFTVELSSFQWLYCGR
jgi:hypothetical protein